MPSKEGIVSWMERVRVRDRFAVQPCLFEESAAWSYRDGEIRHVSGRFFQIVGRTWQAPAQRMWQPFIQQLEIGNLGFVSRQNGNGVELLLQAKTEPGNVGAVQIGPTCQATQSNRDRIHGGTLPPYSGYFDAPHGRVVSTSLQSEQGTRFLNKRNRNIVIDDPDAELADDQHLWVPFRDLRGLLCDDFIVNTDSRSVLCTTDWRYLAAGRPFDGADEISQIFRASFEAPIRSQAVDAANAALAQAREKPLPMDACALDDMPGWTFDVSSATPVSGDVLQVRYMNVHSETREVANWDQPLVDTRAQFTVDLLIDRSESIATFGFRVRQEPGLFQIAELAPSWQYTSPPHEVPVLLEVRQSDEGGRFYQDISLYRIVDAAGARADSDLVWLNLAEIYHLLPQGHFTNESRSVLSLLLSRL